MYDASRDRVMSVLPKILSYIHAHIHLYMSVQKVFTWCVSRRRRRRRRRRILEGGGGYGSHGAGSFAEFEASEWLLIWCAQECMCMSMLFGYLAI